MTDTTQTPGLRDQIHRIITLDHLQLLSDFDVDGDLYRLDPECRDSAYATADAILGKVSAEADALRAEVARLRGERVSKEAVVALSSYQQADEDGIMVLVSRQAIEECLPALRALAPGDPA